MSPYTESGLLIRWFFCYRKPSPDRSHAYTKPEDVKGAERGFLLLRALVVLWCSLCCFLPFPSRTPVFLCCLPSNLWLPRQSQPLGSCPSGKGFSTHHACYHKTGLIYPKNAIKKSQGDFFYISIQRVWHIQTKRLQYAQNSLITSINQSSIVNKK